MDRMLPIKHKKIEEFVDRTEIRECIMDIIKNRIQETDFFKLISIYGMGGTGKTCLINELESKIKAHSSKVSEKIKLIKVSFEISNNKQFIENIVKLAAQYDHSCILFEYALLKYHEKIDIYQLDNKIIRKIQSNFFSNFADSFLESVDFLQSKLNPKSVQMGIPSISGILDVIGDIHRNLKKIPLWNNINDIDEMNKAELLYNLPIYLGMDILRNENQLVKKGKKRNLVFIFDSYIPSKPYSGSSEWLFRFISSLQMGLHIITSREKLVWKFDAFKPYELKAYPEEDTRKYLSKHINKQDIIDIIIESTQCVPIYVDLAVNVYKKESELINENIMNKAIFNDRETLVSKFIDHLDPKWREVILNLTTVRVFNKDIFENIIKSCNLSCPYYDYKEIVNVSLVQYIENDGDFVKLHDVFCKNAIKVLPFEQIIFNLNNYLEYIIYREVYNNISSLNIIVMLLYNIINIESDFNNSVEVPTFIVEKTLDLFFMIFDANIDLQCIDVKRNTNIVISDMIHLMNAINEKKNGTKESLFSLNKISDSNNLGYHKKSYDIFLQYTYSLTGDYYRLAVKLNTLNKELTDDECIHWYYSQIKLYTADLELIQGKFYDALEATNDMEKAIDDSIFSFYSFFQIQRTRGHLYRFNGLWEDAFNEYNKVLEHYNCGLATKAYICTNLIETKCYYDERYVINNFQIALDYVKQDNQRKNEAKIYYSKAIADILLCDYEEAQNNIDESIQLNKIDGYRSGELFAYMAQAYLEYARYSSIFSDTLDKIEKLLNDNEVYLFFRLPIAVMQKDDDTIISLKKAFQWLDFDTTLKNYRNFINRLENINEVS